MITTLRSALFTVAFFVTTAVMSIVGAPIFLLGSQRAGVGYTQLWGRVSLVLLRVLAGIRLEVRGREHLPTGPALVAAKHQSAFETFALLPILVCPTMVMKIELLKIPLFGAYSRMTGMILVDRSKRGIALRDLVRRGREETAKGRQIAIFPEGTRRGPGAPPAYQPGVALLYKGLGLPTIPAALNSGVFWPRRSLGKYPGTIVIEFLPRIEPGLDSDAFLERLEIAIETATDRLLAEAAHSANPPPLSPEARERLKAIERS